MTTKRKRDGLWFSVATRFARNAKVLKAGGDAVLLWLFCMGYAREELTDGFVPEVVVETYGGVRKPTQAAERLVTAGMLERVDGGYQLHGFDEWAETRADVESRRADARDRQTKSRLSRRDNDVLSQRDTGVSHSDVTLQSRAEQSRAEQKPADAGSPAHAPDSTDSEHETPCPADLVARAERAGVLTDLAEKLRAPLESVEDAAREFVSYWLVGAGIGQRRRHWMRKLREHIRKRHGEGGLRAPGALQHATTTGPGMTQGEASVAALLARVGR